MPNRTVRCLITVAAMLVTLTRPVFASSVNSQWGDQTREYDGPPQDEYVFGTWTLHSSGLANNYFVIDDYPGCPYELTEPELCPDHEREWYEDNLPVMLPQASWTCTANNCSSQLAEKCTDMNAMMVSNQNPGPAGPGSCKAGYAPPTGVAYLWQDCTCECQGSHIAAGQRIVVKATCDVIWN